VALHVDALSLDIWFWLNEACTKDHLSYLLLNCIQISPVTSHNQQTLFSRHSVPLVGHSIYVRLRQQAMLLLFIQILQLKNFFVKLLFFCWVCVKAHEWYTSIVEQQNLVTRKSGWSACCVSILEWIQHKSHAI